MSIILSILLLVLLILYIRLYHRTKLQADHGVSWSGIREQIARVTSTNIAGQHVVRVSPAPADTPPGRVYNLELNRLNLGECEVLDGTAESTVLGFVRDGSLYLVDSRTVVLTLLESDPN